MSLEVRQLVLKATVDEETDEDEGTKGRQKATGGCGGAEGDNCEDREQLKEEILAECRTWMLIHLQQLRER